MSKLTSIKRILVTALISGAVMFPLAPAHAWGGGGPSWGNNGQGDGYGDGDSSGSGGFSRSRLR